MFSLFLGTHSRLVGLGGIERSVQLLGESLANSKKSLQCTCGATAVECKFWGEIARRIPSHPPNTRRARYELVLETFRFVFGSDMWPVDSSKHVEPLEDLCRIDSLDLRVAHVIKDVRSLSTSFIDQARRKGKKRAGAFLALEYFRRWRRENGKIDGCITRNRIKALRVGYEEVCLAPEIIMSAISAFLDVPKEPGSLSFELSNSHLIAGNRMRGQEQKQTLRYDHRWFARREWLPAALLFPSIMRYNSRAVYSSRADEMWRR